MICDACRKLRKRNKHGVIYSDCAVLEGGGLPVWGPECAAYTDDPQWWEKAKRAGEEYQARKGGR